LWPREPGPWGESFENGRRYIVEKAELTELIRSIPLATMGVSSPVAPDPPWAIPSPKKYIFSGNFMKINTLPANPKNHSSEIALPMLPLARLAKG
jgi:hypothetical protein